MKITAETVEKLSALAHIALHSEEQRLNYVKDLNQWLELIEKINEVDTQHITPMAHPLEVYQPLRPDEVTEPNVRDAMEKLAPNTQSVEAGLYLVPQVIEDKSNS